MSTLSKILIELLFGVVSLGTMTIRMWSSQTARDDNSQVSCVNSYLHDGSLIRGFSCDLPVSLSSLVLLAYIHSTYYCMARSLFL